VVAGSLYIYCWLGNELSDQVIIIIIIIIFKLDVQCTVSPNNILLQCVALLNYVTIS
jgi:hypothetical protein